MPTEPVPEKLVLSYLGEKVYHRSKPGDEFRPACRPTRIRGVPMMRVRAERIGLSACPDCWPERSRDEPGDQ